MNAKLLLTAAALATLVGCAVVPLPAHQQMCRALDIALNESGDLAPAWYTTAGAASEDACGDETGRGRGAIHACLAEVREGYRPQGESCFGAGAAGMER